ncbi:hypothetical protein [Allorhizocola rhizosphaerae]|uniref:hypothetical protein n=1 Tax=Allorhizocola rhizosphaerae TaxID=1872709 RepID=UPI0013C348EC|nr:hypothetical protein [Allorhizocola rhizosphaerae]
MSQRRPIAAAAVMLAAVIASVVAMVVVANPAHASGGGCSDITQRNWHIGVCSGDDGRFMYPDFYINAPAPYSGTCTSKVRVDVFRDGVLQGYTGWVEDGCAIGHYWGSPVKIEGRTNLDFRTRVQIVVNGSIVYNALGPATRCC